MRSVLLELEVWLEEGAQLHPAAMKATLEGGFAHADDLGCLSCREALDVS